MLLSIKHFFIFHTAALISAGREIIWRNGGTGGFRSFAGMDKGKQVGVVVLSNTALSVDEIGQGALSILAANEPN